MKIQFILSLAMIAGVFAHPTPFHNERLAPYYGGAIYDTSGKVVGDKEWAQTGAAFDMEAYFENDRCAVQIKLPEGSTKEAQENAKWGFIDKENNLVIEAKYDSVLSFRDGLAPVSLNGKWGYIDPSGNTVITHQWDYAGYFSEGAAAVVKDGKIGFINKTGILGIPAEHPIDVKHYATWLNDVKFEQGLAAFTHDKKWGCMNKKGEVVIPFVFERIGKFNGELAPAQKDGKWGYVNKLGKDVIHFKYNYGSNFHNGLALVKGDGLPKYINAKGEKVTDIVPEGEKDIVSDFAHFWKLNHDRFPIQRAGKIGFMDSKGNIVIQPKWERVNGFLPSGLCGVHLHLYDKDGDKAGVIGTKGEYVLPCEYKSVTTMYDIDTQDGMIHVGDASGQRHIYNVAKKKMIQIK